VPFNTTDIVCGVKCAIEWAGTKEAKKHVKKAKNVENRAAKAKLRRQKVAWWHDEKNTGSTAYECHKYIRARDAHLPCISCGKDEAMLWVASHFRSRGAASHLRYTVQNINKACSECNSHLSGNIGPYRIGLVAKYGEDEVLALEHNNEIKRWTVEECETLRNKFRQMTKELEAKGV